MELGDAGALPMWRRIGRMAQVEASLTQVPQVEGMGRRRPTMPTTKVFKVFSNAVVKSVFWPVLRLYVCAR